MLCLCTSSPNKARVLKVAAGEQSQKPTEVPRTGPLGRNREETPQLMELNVPTAACSRSREAGSEGDEEHAGHTTSRRIRPGLESKMRHFTQSCACLGKKLYPLHAHSKVRVPITVGSQGCKRRVSVCKLLAARWLWSRENLLQEGRAEAWGA